MIFEFVFTSFQQGIILIPLSKAACTFILSEENIIIIPFIVSLVTIVLLRLYYNLLCSSQFNPMKSYTSLLSIFSKSLLGIKNNKKERFFLVWYIECKCFINKSYCLCFYYTMVMERRYTRTYLDDMHIVTLLLDLFMHKILWKYLHRWFL